MTELSKTYDPQGMEKRIYERWKKMGYFHADEKSKKKAFSIVMPPPNVTGQLHMGHALDNTLQDALCRYKRMQGYEVLWQPGTDHAAIATEVKVIEKLKKQGIEKHDLGREGFLKEAWAWKEEYESRILGQLEKIGASADWQRLRFTMDEGCSKAVTEVFIKLYEKGYIYKGNRIINWCPVCKTSISDAEVLHEDQDSFFWHINYPISGEEGRFVEIATTRPETLLGDTAVAVNPNDERYKDLVGKMLKLPLTDREIPVIADEYVDMEFGTGCVKITPAHDPNDFEVGKRHDLPEICILNDDATINCPGSKYDGMDRYEARKLMVEDLEAQGLLVKTVPHAHSVGIHDRCHTTIEPMVKPQWFVRMDKFAEDCRKVLESGELKFVPENYSKTYLNWVNNMRDWCISRQLWWGHRIPAYYCEDCGEIMVAGDMPKTCTKCGSAHIHQDEDTLDTWFSSALWPFSTMGWPEDTETLRKFYPTDVLVTGYDIIFFWVIRMVFSGVEQTGKCPFHTVLIHGLVRDSQGRKMSKSLGNGIDPIEVIEKYGADALRGALLTGNAPGNDMRFYWEKVENERNFANKVWNAARFILMNIDKAREEYGSGIDDILKDAGKSGDRGAAPASMRLERPDKWILSKVGELSERFASNMDAFELGIALDNVTDFIWDEYCDWYIEMVKPRLYGSDRASKEAALWTLKTVLSDALKLLHPFMPFITEEIFTSLTDEESIMVSDYPVRREDLCFKEDEESIELIKEAVRAVRAVRKEMNVPQGRKAQVYLMLRDASETESFSSSEDIFKLLCGASELVILKEGEEAPENSVSKVLSSGTLYIPLSELVDIAKERERLSAERDRLLSELKRSESILSNEKFLSKAPKEKVEEEQQKKQKYEEMLRTAEERLRAL
ncbi:MAG TPA: valine--tRNA ligase [Candidatus Avilachnospira avistercoris]|nr:valine--tRNA ligase [Candidatus Avilachnospira avistercoris]